MPPYTNLRWEKALEGWELYGVDEELELLPTISLLGWVYENHARGTWQAKVYVAYGTDLDQEFQYLEDAQSWVVACARMT